MSLLLPAPPPRSVPLLLRVHACFGGTVSWIGWGFVLLGLIIAGGLGLGADVATPLALSQGATLQDTTLSGVAQTSFSTGGDEYTEGEPVYAYVFEYPVDGETYSNTSYVSGRVADEGDTVTIEVAVSAPDKARIVGMRASPFGPWALLAFLGPLAGVPFVVWSVGRGLRANHLLAHGLVTAGRLLEKKATATQVNKRRVFAYVFEYRDTRDRRHRVTLRTSLTWRVEDDVEEPVVFDPSAPERAMLVDALPGHPGIEPDGGFTVEQPVAAVLSMLLPTLTTLLLLGYGMTLLL